MPPATRSAASTRAATSGIGRRGPASRDHRTSVDGLMALPRPTSGSHDGRMTKPLDVLLIESRTGEGVDDADRLEAAGHRVHRCWTPTETGSTSETGALCTGVTADDCPLEHGIDVALLVRRRITPRPTSSEGGVSCALRAGVPVVEDGPDVFDPYEPWLAARVAGGDVATACAEAVERGFDALRSAIADRVRAVLRGAGVDPAAVSSTISYEHPRLTVVLRGPVVTTPVQQALGVRVLDAVRGSDRTYGQVDVAYEPEA